MPLVSTHYSNDWTAFGYAQLVESLGWLTRIGTFQEGSLASALAVARLIDRGRILRSGLSPLELQRALERYRQSADWTPVPAIERALEQAIAIAVEATPQKAIAATYCSKPRLRGASGSDDIDLPVVSITPSGTTSN
jgi:hypothetical protein